MAEDQYERGYKEAWREVLRKCCMALGYEDIEAGKALWIIEREEIKAALREVCIDFGDIEYSDDLHLVDVIEKHLHRHLVRRHNEQMFDGDVKE